MWWSHPHVHYFYMLNTGLHSVKLQPETNSALPLCLLTHKHDPSLMTHSYFLLPECHVIISESDTTIYTECLSEVFPASSNKASSFLNSELELTLVWMTKESWVHSLMNHHHSQATKKKKKKKDWNDPHPAQISQYDPRALIYEIILWRSPDLTSCPALMI